MKSKTFVVGGKKYNSLEEVPSEFKELFNNASKIEIIKEEKKLQ